MEISKKMDFYLEKMDFYLEKMDFYLEKVLPFHILN